MKLYEMAKAPNPRRVRMFLAEKGLLDKVERIEIDLSKGENLSDAFKAKNPMQKVPVLELDDGSFICETTAICHYFENQYPDSPKLLGDNANDKAIIEQWTRWVDFTCSIQLAWAFSTRPTISSTACNPSANGESTISKRPSAFLTF